MENFINLPAEKQKIIIDAALKAFGANGYKKTSTSDIAAAAGISKAMIFHYFGSKKALYLYLFELCGNLFISEVNEKFDKTVSDFFERLKLSTEIEMAVMRQHPAIPAFLASAYFETDEEVKDDIKAMLEKGDNLRNMIAFEGMDFSRFKEGIDLKLVMKMLSWIADGYANQLSRAQGPIDFEAMYVEFFDCLDLLRNNFYKEEYL